MKQNQTFITYFIIKGISDVPELQAPIFLLVLLIYIIVLVGNMSLLLLVCLDSHLHTPMYFFLANLSIADMTSSTVTLHKILVTFITGDNTMLYLACMVQAYMFGSLSGHALFILTAMSYDRYVAVCRPLNYHIIMNLKICLILASFCWIFGFLQVVPFSWFLSEISCFSTNVIDHFFCDLVPIMNIACSDIVILESLNFIQGLTIYIITPFLLTFVSYVFIIRAIMKIRSSFGRRKAFYTCSSHLTVITLLYTTLILQYAIPNNGLGSKKLFSLFNTAMVPILNPLIYSLKNKDVKSAFIKVIRKCKVESFTVT
ncbi:olfactory receptor 5B12-like [Bufo gargarizans]|uniref:olfactory receptor 5B12-like n=1 Tax=Bufo gargarizans TaxID=30331 RepID=UPI001CF23483|nr:olfactory receptor 5B12-like [Bufo gargarizans]